jgi:cobalt-zinc-cadmium efflux system membrane fusion protein
MKANEEYQALLHAQGESHLIPGGQSPASPADSGITRRRMGLGQKIIVALLLTVVIVPPMAAFYSYFSGVPLHLMASKKDEEESSSTTALPSVSLVTGQAHTLEVPDEVAVALGVRKGDSDSIALAQPPKTMRPLVLPGSTALDPTRLERVRARFAPARVISLAQVHDISRKTGQSEFRELRPGDTVSKGDLLGVFYSVDVGSKKNDLLDALVQLELDQKIMDRVEENRQAIPEVMYLTQWRQVQGDRNAINRALENLKLWDIPQEEIDALHAEAKKISADKNAWFKTAEGRWVKGEKQTSSSKGDPLKQGEDPWGRVTLRANFDGVIVERNVHQGEMVVDNTVNLFQIADVSRLLVIANCPEDEIPTLEALQGVEKQWTVRTVGASSTTGLPGTIDEIGYVIDPNQHTAVIKGYVDNPGRRIRGGQFVTATINIPPPEGVVEIPADALVDDGIQSLLFVQPDPATNRFRMRRVHVTHRYEHTVFVRSTPIPKDEQLTALEAEEGLLPKEALRPGERVLSSGAVELKAALLDLESQPEKQSTDRLARAKTVPFQGLESRPDPRPRTGKG